MTLPDRGPEGLGGWLWLVAIGLILTPFRVLGMFLTDLLPIFSEGYWTLLTDPASSSYHALWAPYIVYEAIGNLIVAAAAVILLTLMLKKSPRFPSLMVAYLAGSLVFTALDHFIATQIPVVAEQDDPTGTADLARTVLSCSIWVPYFKMSRRVHNTFRPIAAGGLDDQPPAA